jgi:outer membrane protein assembly factor BamB
MPSGVYKLSADSLLELAAPWPSFGRSQYRHGLSPFVGPSSSDIKWTYDTASTIYSSPAVGEGEIIYFGTSDDFVYAIDSDGVLVWKIDLKSTIRSSPAIGQGGDLYISSMKGLHAIATTDGSQTWEYLVDGGSTSSPMIDNTGSIFFAGFFEPYLFKVDNNGGLTWSCELTDNVVKSSPAMMSTGIVVVGTDDGQLYAIRDDTSICTIIWSYNVGGAIRSSPLIDDSDNVYVTSRNAKLVS